MRFSKLSGVVLSFCAVLCCSADAQISESEQKFLDNYEAEQKEMKVNLAVTKINWIRDVFIIKELSSMPSEFLRDCSLTYSIGVAYMGGELEVHQKEKAVLSSHLFRAASASSVGKSKFERKVFSTAGNMENIELVQAKFDECENAINPFFADFAETLEDSGQEGN